jgi:phage tail sheath protein FI
MRGAAEMTVEPPLGRLPCLALHQRAPAVPVGRGVDRRRDPWVVFEPNDEPLSARMRQSSDFLLTVCRRGARGRHYGRGILRHMRPHHDDQDDIDNGRLICFIGIATVKAAEFVIFRIGQNTREQQT